MPNPHTPSFSISSQYTLLFCFLTAFSCQLPTAITRSILHEITPFFFHNQLQLPPENSQVVSLVFIKISTSKQPSKLRCAETDQLCYLHFFITVKELLRPRTKLRSPRKRGTSAATLHAKACISFFLDS
ncbi:hypothetical protein E3N88_38941 [Mikania micrantha]|uniref:Secreted protein n=1 Tax=Mikania micrantha TaxID=192012 RepID=A0A5N6LVC7_9ASTR|nr:hypothetical protein E3N88_38941 [Mikania micrantha]